MGWIGFAGRLAAGGVFLASGLLKASQPAEEFAAVVEAYRLLPFGMVLPFARALPWAETFLGAFLLAGYLTRWSGLGAAAMSGMFLLGLLSTQARGIELANCGCFGEAGLHLTPFQAMGLDAFLLACALAAFRLRGSGPALDRWIETGTDR